MQKQTDQYLSVYFSTTHADGYPNNQIIGPFFHFSIFIDGP